MAVVRRSGVSGVSGRARKKALLIAPEFPYDSFWGYRYVIRLIGRKAAFPPLGLLTFAAYLPDDWDLELADLNVTSPSDRVLRTKIAQADAVFVSAMSIQKRSLVDLLRGPARGLDTPFVLGGPFASSYRDQIVHPCTESDRILHEGLDVLVWGEAAGAMGELLAYLDSDPAHSSGPPRLLIPRSVAAVEPGSRGYLNDRSIFRPLDGVPLPRWDLIRVKDYYSMMIQTTAGCPFRCDFCDIIQFNGGFNRPKDPEAVSRELGAILDTGYRGSVFSVDDNFIGMPAATSEILDAMIEFQRRHGYPFTFYTQASVNLGTPKLEHLVDKMKLAGFDAVFLGIENPDPDALIGMNKKQNLKVDIPRAIARIQAAGIEVYAGFIFGADQDTPSTADRIIEFVRETKIFTAMTGMLTPVPHTPLYQRLRRERRLSPAEYTGNNTDDDVQFAPMRMSAEELRQGIHHILHSLFRPAESYRRGLEMLAAVTPHIFARRRIDTGLLKAALVSLWAQGVRRLDPNYFKLLWNGFKLDRLHYRRARHEARRLAALKKALAGEKAAEVGLSRERLDELIGLAHEYLVRFRPEESLEQVRRYVGELRERVRSGIRHAEDVSVIYENAVKYLRARMARHRFPGVKLLGAFEAAIKGLHYEKVMRSIIAGGSADSTLSRTQ
ncbi:MAG: DUF4070 domain-containing protein [Gemmatimonadetes bacterium]|nr:DUF4070 domain-containing protein [Gemmatimonadota bacterium]